MQQYDDVVVGSGVSGLTLALLLGLNDRRVLLLEKAPAIGGSLVRFRRAGLPFDTGFHFTGGFSEGGILSQMLRVLGIDGRIQPLCITRDQDNRIILEDTGAVYDLPIGYPALIEALTEYFPAERDAVTSYFRMVREVYENTVSMNLRAVGAGAWSVAEDHVSLESVLDRLTRNATLKLLLSYHTLCYGVRPSEISFANHSRVAHSLYDSLARVRDGGDAFVRAFRDGFAGLDVEVRCGTHLVACEDVSNRRVGRFVLNTGEDVVAEHCTFTIHPQEIVKVLPTEYLSKAFKTRVAGFEPSIGFFSVYACVDAAPQVEEFGPAIISLMPRAELDGSFDAGPGEDMPLVLLKNREFVDGQPYNMLNALEMSLPSHVARWADTVSCDRPADYAEYKAARLERIKCRLFAQSPEYEPALRVIDTASMLTYKDYLNNPDGCAYGIKQKMGQFSLLGRLPLGNLYTAGQSAALPGLVGAMMSSFIVARLLIGRDRYGDFVERRLGAN